MNILAIESSCDETSVAVISESKVLSNVISSQLFHGKFGGVIPELASRAHIKLISSIVKQSLEESSISMNDISAIAVTSEPGLVGSLIVGSNFAKGLAVKYNLLLIPVNHIEGHIYSACLQDSAMEFPFVALVVSGGHTALFLVESYDNYQILGLTRDDAAGEAFDKTAALLGLPYPGGPEIDKLATQGNPKAYDFPRGMFSSYTFDFSFSGLKTSVRYYIEKNFRDGIPQDVIPHLCASIQEAIVDVLVEKSIAAAVKYKVKSLSISGGVSANSRLRKKITESAENRKLKVVIPDFSYCMDNAAMIGFIAEKKFSVSNKFHYNLTFTVNPSSLRAKKKH
jgi:N6-L-threonylcarbamoyladenine synthase